MLTIIAEAEDPDDIMMRMKPFTHLHVHSHYSLLNALPKVPELIKAAKDAEMEALALTDNGSMYGAIEFYDKCKQNDIKPIIGVDFYVAPRTRHDKEPKIDNRWSRLVLLAKDETGYKNLIKLVTIGHLEGFYYKPRIDRELIEKYSEGLVCILPFFSGEISKALKLSDETRARENFEWYKKVFKDDLYLEITHHPEIEDALGLEKFVKEFAAQNKAQLVAAHDVYYINPEDREARKTLLSIQSTFGSGGYSTENEDFSFLSQKKMNEIYADLPEALENTQKIVEKCNVEIELGKWKFPDYKIESGKSPDDELRDLTYKGIEWREMEKNDELMDRIEYELKVIKDKGYAKYFLAVSDLLKFAKENGILSNTRGSAAGSLVSYLNGITIVDPIASRLPFERFLNPERPSAPDVDMDFADDRRDDVIQYAREKYGKEHVAQIGTFGTMMARGSVRDTARALGYDYDIGDKIAKLIPMGAQGFPMTIDRAIDEVPELDELIKKDDDVKKIVDMARKIEGCARHIGVHAAGVVISPDKLEEDVPVQWDPKGEGKLITQYDMHSVGEDGVGLLKFDFLGLKNLTIMGNTVRLIEKLRNEEIDIDRIPLDNEKTYKMLSRGETAATFQLNGQGMTRFLKELKPTRIDDINAMVALYRPGPLAFIPDYIERKNNPEKVRYIDDRLKEILEPTFGILIYQDDVMMIAVKFANYSWGEADKFRKAMGKKIPEVMAEQKEKFMKGCIEHGGLSEENTQKLWDSIETFAAYGFNKAHAASYGRVAYLTSYLKANYPVIYMASVLSAESGDVEKVAEMIDECKRMKIEVLPPSVNESFADFTVVRKDNKETGEIRFGLTSIKNFGEGIANAVIEEREANGKFVSLEDFLRRCKGKNLNKKSLEALAKSGALDELTPREQIIANIDQIIEFNKTLSNEAENQDSLFGETIDTPPLQMTHESDISPDQKLAWEKELLGLYVSGHPLDKYKELLSKNKVKIEKIKVQKIEGMNLIVTGIVTDVRAIRTKKGDDMAFVKIADFTGTIEAVVFPETFKKNKEFLEIDRCLAIKGKLSLRNDEPSIIADSIKPLSTIKTK